MAKTMDARRRSSGARIESDLLGKGMEGVAKGAAPDGAVGLKGEEWIGRRQPRYPLTAKCKVTFEMLSHHRTVGDQAAFPELGLSNYEEAAVSIDIADAKVQDFSSAKPKPIKDSEDHPVRQAAKAGCAPIGQTLGQKEQASSLIHLEQAWDSDIRIAAWPSLDRGVVDHLPCSHPAEKVANNPQ
jgi:hypothetical protein